MGSTATIGKGLEGEFTGVATLDRQQNLRNTHRLPLGLQDAARGLAGRGHRRRAAERVAVREPRVPQASGLVRRAALLSALLVLLAGGLPAEAPAKRKCHKRACKSKVLRAKRAGHAGELDRARPDHDVAAQGRLDPARPAAARRRTRGADPPPPPPPPPPPADPRYLQVVARDSGSVWALQPSRSTLLSGSVSVEFNNRFAEDPHDLKLRHDGTTFAFPDGRLGRRPHGVARPRRGRLEAVVLAARPRGQGHGRLRDRRRRLIRRVPRLACGARCTSAPERTRTA